MSQFQIIASTMMLIIIFWVSMSKLFAKKQDEEGLSDEEKAILYPKTNDSMTEHKMTEDFDSQDAAFEQIMPFDVIDAIKSGNKLLAIKLYRDQFSANLKDSKEAVERMAQSIQR